MFWHNTLCLPGQPTCFWLRRWLCFLKKPFCTNYRNNWSLILSHLQLVLSTEFNIWCWRRPGNTFALLHPAPPSFVLHFSSLLAQAKTRMVSPTEDQTQTWSRSSVFQNNSYATRECDSPKVKLEKQKETDLAEKKTNYGSRENLNDRTLAVKLVAVWSLRQQSEDIPTCERNGTVSKTEREQASLRAHVTQLKPDRIIFGAACHLMSTSVLHIEKENSCTTLFKWKTRFCCSNTRSVIQDFLLAFEKNESFKAWGTVQ